MAGTRKNWLVGCGIGCGLMLLILGGVGTCGYLGVRKVMDEADGLDESFEAIEANFGEPTDFVPRADGVIAVERMEAFLAIRDDMAPTRNEVSDMLHTLDDGGHWIAKAKAGIKLVPSMMGFIGVRNKTLVDHGMGVGEYQYIYALSYFVLLHKDPADGPSFVLAGDDAEDNDGNMRVNWGVSSNKQDVAEARARRVREFVNNIQTVVLDNQVTAYRATLPTGVDLATDPWGAQLLAEQEAMQLETLRLPWEEGLPTQILGSLEPYRVRLDESYDAMTSIIEMGLTDED